LIKKKTVLGLYAYEPGGREFESLRARQKTKGPFTGPFFFCCVWMKMRAPVRQIACDLDAEGAPQG